MRKLFILGAVMAALVVPTASRAQFSLGLRLGYAPAGGDAVKDQKMSEGVKSQIPIQLDGLYNVNKNIAAGLYFSYGIAQLASDACPSGASCSANVMRFGVQGIYSFAVAGSASKFVPWAGLGLGYEMGNEKVEGIKSTVSGFEGQLQLGGDYMVNPKFAVGPFFQLGIGQYSSIKVDGEKITGFDKALHEWYGFGIRGKYDL